MRLGFGSGDVGVVLEEMDERGLKYLQEGQALCKHWECRQFPLRGPEQAHRREEDKSGKASSRIALDTRCSVRWFVDMRQ